MLNVLKIPFWQSTLWGHICYFWLLPKYLITSDLCVAFINSADDNFTVYFLLGIVLNGLWA